MRSTGRICIYALTIGASVFLAAAGGGAGSAGAHEHAPETGAHGHSPHGGLVEPFGGQRLELTFDDRNGAMTLYVLKAGDPMAQPLTAVPLTVRVEPSADDVLGGPFELELMPIPQAGDPQGLASRFFGRDAELLGLERFSATVRLADDDEIRQVGFAVDESTFHSVFLCPMRCEGERTYAREGRCPVCGMELGAPEEAHGDHTPRHGGVLFMAPDGWHHLEGVRSSTDEFRLYLYDDFTRPISALPFAEGSWAQISAPEAPRDVTPNRVKLEFSASAAGDYLTLPIPDGMTGALEIEVRVKFVGRDDAERFDFNFDENPN